MRILNIFLVILSALFGSIGLVFLLNAIFYPNFWLFVSAFCYLLATFGCFTVISNLKRLKGLDKDNKKWYN